MEARLRISSCLIRFGATAMLLIALQGCLGGGTLATGLGEGYGGRGLSGRQGVKPVLLRGRLVDARGKALSGVNVSIVTVAGAAETISDSNGEFDASVDSVPFTRIELNFSAPGIDSRVSIDTDEQDTIIQDFILSKGK